jgi:hypothetical protein
MPIEHQTQIIDHENPCMGSKLKAGILLDFWLSLVG